MSQRSSRLVRVKERKDPSVERIQFVGRTLHAKPNLLEYDKDRGLSLGNEGGSKGDGQNKRGWSQRQRIGKFTLSEDQTWRSTSPRRADKKTINE